MTAEEIIVSIETRIAAIRKSASDGATEVELLQELRTLDYRHHLDIRQRLTALGQRPACGWDPIVSIT